MREIKFQFLYKGLPFSSDNDKCNWHKKVYTLEQLTNAEISKICDMHGICELVAKRQCTGLNDKNGVEIYEGDILKRAYILGGSRPDIVQYYNLLEVLAWRKVKYKREGAIVLDDARARSYQKTEERDYRHPTVGKNWVTDIEAYDIPSVEVIGNIYENPELLNN
tara:strand:- start:430 stop:924 length:495 start_codon:yes stop_codon:yes gene_type:complete